MTWFTELSIFKENHQLNYMTNNESTPKLPATYVSELLEVSLQAIHKHLKTHNLQCAKVGNKSYITHNIAKKLFNLKFEHKKI